MHPSQQQPDLGVLPPPPNMPSPGSQTGPHSSISQDTEMRDAYYHSSLDESPPKDGRGLNINSFFRTKTKTTKDGVPAKKRGPKRDSKPAISRRQELNRQAQRTHRERKEYYTKSLEGEVCRCRELYAALVKEKQALEKRTAELEQQLKDANVEALQHENDRLKQLLQVNGITYDRLLPVAGGPTPVTRPQQQPQSFSVEPQMATNKRQISPTHSHLPILNGHQPAFQSQASFNTQPSSFPAGQMDTHPALRQPTLGNTTTITSHGAQPNIPTSTTSVSPSQTSMQDVRGQYHQHHPASTSGSSYAPSLPTSVSLSSRTTPTQIGSLSRETSLQDSNPINSVVATSSASSFRPPVGQGLVNGRVQRNRSEERIKQVGMDHDQYGIDFVLTLESNCKDHTVFLNLRANPPAAAKFNNELSGHAMMLSNPLPSNLAQGPEKCTHEPPNLPADALVELMETAQRLPLEGGEIPPVLALRIIREDERYGLITPEDFRKITQILRESSRCYGFGAVLETYEVHDALDTVLGPLTR